MEWYWIVLIVCGSLLLWGALSVLLYRQFFKRFYDFLFSALALLILSPVLLVLTAVGAIAMRGNPFFCQARPGRTGKDGNERIFRIVKFRTMTNAKANDGSPLPDEDRLTAYGRFLRSTSLDELPELLNIFCGQMSFLGPRPQLVRDMTFMTSEQRRRHTVRPGLSGLAQINGRNAISWDDKLDWDLKYIARISLFGDLKLIFRTAAVALFRHEGVTDGESATAADYGDWLLMSGRITREEYDARMGEAQTLLNEFYKAGRA